MQCVDLIFYKFIKYLIFWDNSGNIFSNLGLQFCPTFNLDQIYFVLIWPKSRQAILSVDLQKLLQFIYYFFILSKVRCPDKFDLKMAILKQSFF